LKGSQSRSQTNSASIPTRLGNSCCCSCCCRNFSGCKFISSVLRQFSEKFYRGPGDKAPPVTLVHGVFGAGKSYLLCVILIFLHRLSQLKPQNKPSSPLKVLVTSSTNVAVDRVLLCLLDNNFTDFLRIGSVRKIAKPILPYTTSGRDSSTEGQLHPPHISAQ